MRRRVFLDPEQQASFDADGFVVVRLFDAEEIAEAHREARQLTPADGFHPSGSGPFPNTYHCTFLDESRAYRRSVYEFTRRWFGDRGLGLLDGYRMLTSNLYVKPPGTGRLEIHQNWPVTDDIGDTSLTMWVPFTDMTVGNGTLHLVPGSHKLVDDLFTLAAPKFFEPFYDDLIADWLEPVEVRAGECVLFDDSILHWSDHNRSDEPRWGAQVILMPAEKTPVLYHFDADHDPPRFEYFAIGPEYYMDHTLADMTRRPDDLPLLGAVERENRMLDLSSFSALMAERRHQAAAGPGRPAGPTELGLRRPDLATRLAADGYVHLPGVLDADTCATLRDAFDEAVRRFGVTVGDRWFPTILLPDPDVRRFIDTELRAALLPVLGEHLDLDVVEPVRIDYSVKPPGPESELGPHQDFSIVDERRWTSLYAWLPLIDTGSENGTLHVLPGSHRFTNRIRSRHVPAMFDPVLDEVERRSVRLDCTAGDLVVMVSGVIHHSPPNRSGSLRLAAHGIFKPRAAPLLFYFADEETPPDQVEIYDVDIDDYIDLALSGRPNRRDMVGRAARPPRYMTPERLADGLRSLGSAT